MKRLWVVVKNELLRYFISPLAYVYLIAFLLLNGSFAIYFGHFIGRGVADLVPMFAYQPWLYLLFIPGICMRLWAEEFRSKTIVQIMTMPVSVSTLVWGKFLASWLFAAVALVLTFPFWITVNLLGSPDNGIIVVSYLGSWLLAGCMLAISQTMSALTKNQVIALVLSVIANFIFFLSGVEYVLGFFRLFAPVTIVDMIASFSFITHFNTAIRGLIELRDVVFFISVVLLFNITTILIVSFKTSGTSRWLKSGQAGYYVLLFVLMLAGFAGLNLAANNFLRMQRYDFTEEKVYTLTPSSQQVLSGIPEEVIAKLYYSPQLGQRNPEMRLMFDQVRQLLQSFARAAPDKFSFHIYNPRPLDDIEDQAIAAGLQPIPLVDVNQNGFFGVVFTDSTDKHEVIPFFAPERKSFLEQDLAEKIYQLYHRRKTVGILSSLPVFALSHEGNYISPEWHIISEIKKFYELKDIRNAEDLAAIDVLLMIHPQKLPEELVEAIKEYSMLGGKTLLLLDTAAEARRIFSPSNTEFYPSDLNGLDDFWGFRFYNEVVVADLENSIVVDATKNYSTNPVFTQDVVQFKLGAAEMNPDFPVTAHLQSILFASASVISPTGRSMFLPLIKAGKNSGLLAAGTVYEGKNPSDLLGMFRPDKQVKYISALLIGKGQVNPFEVIVVADTDFIYDTFWSVGRTVLEKNYFIPVFDNGNFILNALDYLAGDNILVNLRGHRLKYRGFEGIENMRKQNLLNFRLKEKAIFDEIEKTRKGLQEIFAKRVFEERQKFSADELSLIAGTRRKLDELRSQLAGIREEMHHNIEVLSLKIKAANIYAIPLLILLVLLAYTLKSAWKPRQRRQKLRINREFRIVGAVVLFLVAAGIISVYAVRQDELEAYENQPVFAGFAEKLNQVQKLSLVSHQGELEFYKQDGIWKLKDYPCFPVYQQRIDRLLAELGTAVFYEKKSDRAEHLSKFGLQPVEMEDSPNVRIEAEGENGEILAALNVGRYDMDIGRGARAAYVKFDNRFQVWMIKADFIDLSTRITDWTYATLWNLRFGRLRSFGKIDNPNRLAEIVKDIINTPLAGGCEKVPEKAPAYSVKLSVEDYAKVTLDFFTESDNICLRYVFDNLREGSYLEFFARNTKNCCYRINPESFEKIKDAITPFDG